MLNEKNLSLKLKNAKFSGTDIQTDFPIQIKKK